MWNPNNSIQPFRDESSEDGQSIQYVCSKFVKKARVDRQNSKTVHMNLRNKACNSVIINQTI